MIKFIYTNFPKQYGKFLYFKNRILLYPKIFFLNLKILNFFGTKDQDKWVVKEIFNRKKRGFFVDLAATNGLLENNTFVLERYFNWNGIAIEPNNLFYNQLKKNRKCICDNSVIGSITSEIEFLENGPIGGIVGDKFDNNYLKRSKLINEFKKNIKKKTMNTLESVLDKNQAPKIIDYLSLDVEGAETEVLINFPFEKYTFLAMSIERPSPELNKLLFNNGYVFVKNFKVDTFYVHKSIENLKQIKKNDFEQLPPKSW